MNSQQKFLARVLFKNKILELDGQAFQDFFVKILGVHSKNFRPIKTQGKVGDKKNDGFCSDEGIYYQVYAPKNPKKPIPLLKL